MFKKFLIIWIIVAAATTGANADTTGLLDKHLDLLDGRMSTQYSTSSRLLPESHKIEPPKASERIPRYSGRYKGKYLPMANAAARKYGVPEELFARLVQQESNWNPRARSHAGAYGLAQLMPGTARYLGVNRRDPRQNLEGGARYLKEQYRKFGSWKLALAAYNAGPGAVQKYNGIPPYRETRNYVRKIMGP